MAGFPEVDDPFLAIEMLEGQLELLQEKIEESRAKGPSASWLASFGAATQICIERAVGTGREADGFSRARSEAESRPPLFGTGDSARAFEAHLLSLLKQLDTAFPEVHQARTMEAARALKNELEVIKSGVTSASLLGEGRARFARWYSRAHTDISELLGEHEAARFKNEVQPPHVGAYLNQNAAFWSPAEAATNYLVALIEEVEEHALPVARGKAGTSHPKSAQPSSSEAVDLIEQICRRLDTVWVELSRRHNGRAPFPRDDEYDTQDLLRALLKLHFDDVRPEEASPSVAGGASRLDLLIPAHRVVIEVKRSRDSLTDKKLGAELIVDAHRYRRHPACEVLVCLVYDPEHRFKNPAGIRTDVEAASTELDVRVLFVPERHPAKATTA